MSKDGKKQKISCHYFIGWCTQSYPDLIGRKKQCWINLVKLSKKDLGLSLD